MRLPFFAVLACLGIFLCGCGSMSTPTSTHNPSSSLRYLALGDSYTIGESVDASQRWPVQLSKLLEERGRQVDLTMIARTGWTVNELWQGIQQSPPQGSYDLVTLLIGVNDEYRGGDVGQYRKDFQFMLDKSIAYAQGKPQHVIVLSIPDWGVTPYAQQYDPRTAAQIGAEIDAFNAVNKEESLKAGVQYVDVTPVSRSAASDPGLIAADGLHPSGRMYTAWAQLTLPAALSVAGLAP